MIFIRKSPRASKGLDFYPHLTSGIGKNLKNLRCRARTFYTAIRGTLHVVQVSIPNPLHLPRCKTCFYTHLIVSTMLWVPSFRILKSDQSCWETLKFSWWTGIEPVKCQILSGCESGLPPGCLFLSALWGILAKILNFYPHRPVAFSDFCAIFIRTWLRDLVGISGVLCKPFMHHADSYFRLVYPHMTMLRLHDWYSVHIVYFTCSGRGQSWWHSSLVKMV